MPSSKSSKSSKGKSTSLGGRSSVPHRTSISINVYDLLPPGKLSTLLWNIGASLVHSGVVIGDREYAYGAHQKPGATGVYFTRPGVEPPGGTFRCEILQGFSLRSQDEIDAILFEASHAFLGPSWNLLKNNCNHFTSYLCNQLTGKPSPSWMNRAASIGMCLPCLVPQQWVEPPDVETADGELLESDEDDERAAMLSHAANPSRNDQVEYTFHEDSDSHETDDDDDLRAKWRRKRRSYKNGAHLISKNDSAGNFIPVSERAPVND